MCMTSNVMRTNLNCVHKIQKFVCITFKNISHDFQTCALLLIESVNFVWKSWSLVFKGPQTFFGIVYWYDVVLVGVIVVRRQICFPDNNFDLREWISMKFSRWFNIKIVSLGLIFGVLIPSGKEESGTKKG